MICVIKPAGEMLIVYLSIFGLVSIPTTIEKLMHTPQEDNLLTA